MRNLWSQRRRRAARVEAMGADGAGPKANLEDELLAGGFSDEVEHALRELPEELRMALLLVSVEEMTYEEVAESMECPIGTVRSRVARARAQMGATLEPARLVRVK